VTHRLDDRKDDHMRVVVDFDRCQGNAQCMSLMPEVFDVDDDGYLTVLDATPPRETWDQLKLAREECPTQAISLVEDEMTARTPTGGFDA
jgi:ferredoxin